MSEPDEMARVRAGESPMGGLVEINDSSFAFPEWPPLLRRCAYCGGVGTEAFVRVTPVTRTARWVDPAWCTKPQPPLDPADAVAIAQEKARRGERALEGLPPELQEKAIGELVEMRRASGRPPRSGCAPPSGV